MIRYSDGKVIVVNVVKEVCVGWVMVYWCFVEYMDLKIKYDDLCMYGVSKVVKLL